MEILKNLNLGIAFLLELAMLVIYGVFGYHLLPAESVGILKIGLAILLPVVMAVFWGFRLAPRAAKRLKMPWLLIAKIIIFGGWRSHVVGTGENIIGNHRGSCDRRAFVVIGCVEADIARIWCESIAILVNLSHKLTEIYKLVDYNQQTALILIIC